MIIGIGTDLIAIERVERVLGRFGQTFVDRCFTETEQQQFQTRSNKSALWAKQFAAKEAVFKALGTGLRAPLGWHDITVLRDTLGKPVVTLSEVALDMMKQSLPEGQSVRIHASITDDNVYALAYVIIEAVQ